MSQSGIPKAIVKHPMHLDQTSGRWKIAGNPQGSVPSGTLVTAQLIEDKYEFRIDNKYNKHEEPLKKGIWNDKELTSLTGEVVRPKDGEVQEDEVVMLQALPGQLNSTSRSGIVSLTSSIEYDSQSGVTEHVQYIVK